MSNNSNGTLAISDQQPLKQRRLCKIPKIGKASKVVKNGKSPNGNQAADKKITPKKATPTAGALRKEQLVKHHHQ